MQSPSQNWIHALRRTILIVTIGILILTFTATIFILRDRLMKDSITKTQELSNAVQLGLRGLMLGGSSTTVLQETFENIVRDRSSIVSICVVDTEGTVIYSSDKDHLGTSMKKSCADCHVNPGDTPSINTIVVELDEVVVHRNANSIVNNADCIDCHMEDPVLGKLIIDRSLQGTLDLIKLVELILIGSGIILIIFIVPFLSRRVSRYVDEITKQTAELSFLNTMIERLSKTINIEELKYIVIDIVTSSLGADEVDIVLPIKNTYRVNTLDRSSGKLMRKKIHHDDALRTVIEDWLGGRLNKPIISDDKKKAYLPISKSDIRLVLIAASKKVGVLDDVGLKLINAISNHTAVAFENARLYSLAITDELTHMFTQRYFRYSIDRMFLEANKYSTELTFLMMDIDDFKKINDTYGHPVGDSVLEIVAEHIMGSTRDSDLTFRYGGEEFVALLPSTNTEKGMVVAERIRKRIEDAVFKFDKVAFKVTISTGLAVYPHSADNARDLIVRADEALYRAKETGKNKVVTYDNTQGT